MSSPPATAAAAAERSLKPSGASRIPSLSPAAQVHYDARRDCWVLLGPDCVLELDPVAHAIIGRLTGRLSTTQIAQSLAREYAAKPDVIAADVEDLLEELIRRHLVFFRD
jgi:pyrroloquinoline quinone biosynthesis protein D